MLQTSESGRLLLRRACAGDNAHDQCLILAHAVEIAGLVNDFDSLSAVLREIRDAVRVDAEAYRIYLMEGRDDNQTEMMNAETRLDAALAAADAVLGDETTGDAQPGTDGQKRATASA